MKIRISSDERFPDYYFQVVTEEDLKESQALVDIGLLNSVEPYKEIDSETVKRWVETIKAYNNLQVELRKLLEDSQH